MMAYIQSALSLLKPEEITHGEVAREITGEKIVTFTTQPLITFVETFRTKWRENPVEGVDVSDVLEFLRILS